MSLVLPQAIADFVEAARDGSVADLLGFFAGDASVLDRGQEYRGRTLSQWAERFLAGPREILRPIRVSGKGPRTVLTVMVGRAKGAIPEQLEWSFVLHGQKISALSIQPAVSPELPPPLPDYVRATNLFDINGLLETFASDAVVNDQLYEYWGHDAIKRWAARDIIGQRTTMYVTKFVHQYGQAVVTAQVDGDYDKRGLPDPLLLTFYFSIAGEKIVQLIILRNESRA